MKKPPTTDLTTRKAWQLAEYGIAKLFPGKHEAIFGAYYSDTAYVPKESEKSDSTVIVYKTRWPGYSVRSGSCVHYAWEAWVDGECVAKTDKMIDAICAVAKELSKQEV